MAMAMARAVRCVLCALCGSLQQAAGAACGLPWVRTALLLLAGCARLCCSLPCRPLAGSAPLGTLKLALGHLAISTVLLHVRTCAITQVQQHVTSIKLIKAPNMRGAGPAGCARALGGDAAAAAARTQKQKPSSAQSLAAIDGRPGTTGATGHRHSSRQRKNHRYEWEQGGRKREPEEAMVAFLLGFQECPVHATAQHEFKYRKTSSKIKHAQALGRSRVPGHPQQQNGMRPGRSRGDSRQDAS
jgi:hypothetical protein